MIPEGSRVGRVHSPHLSEDHHPQIHPTSLQPIFPYRLNGEKKTPQQEELTYWRPPGSCISSSVPDSKRRRGGSASALSPPRRLPPGQLEWPSNSDPSLRPPSLLLPVACLSWERRRTPFTASAVLVRALIGRLEEAPPPDWTAAKTAGYPHPPRF